MLLSKFPLPLMLGLLLAPGLGCAAGTGKRVASEASFSLSALASEMTNGCLLGPVTQGLLKSLPSGGLTPAVNGLGPWSGLQRQETGVLLRTARVVGGATMGGVPVTSARFVHSAETGLDLLVLVTPAVVSKARDAFAPTSHLLDDGSQSSEMVFLPAPEGGTAATCAY